MFFWRTTAAIGLGLMTLAGCGGDGDYASTTDDVTEAPQTAELPIVLVHAFHATTSNGWSMENVARVLTDEGHFVHLASVPPYAGTPERAAVLATEIDRAREAFCRERSTDDVATCTASTQVHLVGHSQGGLDARYVVSKLGYGPHTASVTTIGAPHRGTPLGDVGLSLLGDPRGEAEVSSLLQLALDNMLAKLLIDAVTPDGLADAFYWLSEARHRRGADPAALESMPDVAGVAYQSWAGVATSDGTLPDVGACDGREHFPEGRAGEFRGLLDAERFGLVKKLFDASQHPNDGHIPVASAQYGDFLGCVPADHLDLIGRPNGQTDDNAEEAGFDYRTFYVALAGGLARIEQRR